MSFAFLRETITDQVGEGFTLLDIKIVAKNLPVQ